MKVIMIVVLFGLLASRDVPGLIKNKKYRKDLVVYSFLMMVGMTLSFLTVFHIYLPIWPQG
jgi:xanthine/uracil permease